MSPEQTPGVEIVRPPKPEPEFELVPLAKLTRKTVERLAPFCQIRLPNDAPQAPLVPKTNSKILRLIQAVDTSMLVAQIGYRLSSDAASMCDPFAPTTTTSNGSKYFSGLSKPEMLQTMAAHGHGHCLKAVEAFRDVQQEIYRIAAATKDSETSVLVPPDPQQPANRHIKLKEVGTNLVANLSLLERFSRSVQDLTLWWEWLEEELMSPNSTLLPTTDKKDSELFARWGKTKAGYLEYYNTIRVVYARYPQLFTTSSTAWQSVSSVPPVPSSPGSSWDGSYEDLGATLGEQGAVDDIARTSSPSHDLLNKPFGNGTEKERKSRMGATTNRQRVKAVAAKLGLAQVFGRKHKKATREEKGVKKEKEKEEEKVNVTDEAEDTILVIDGQSTAQPAPSTDKSLDGTVINDTSASVPGSSQPREPPHSVAEKEVQGNGTVVVVQGGAQVRPGEFSSEEATKEAENEKKEEEKSMLVGMFVKLKGVLVKLGCQTVSGIED